MKKKNAFTLIELLAVIIILGVILLIVIPASLNTINNAGKNVFTNSAKKIIDLANIYAMDNSISNLDNTYFAVSITDLKFENSEEYGTEGGVLIVNHGTELAPDYDYYVYLQNNEFIINGANKNNIKENVKNIGTEIPYIPVSLPSGNVLINRSLGITGDVLNVSQVGAGYETITESEE